MLCSHCPVNDSSGYLYSTDYLAVMLQAHWHTGEGTKRQKLQISSMRDCKNVITSTLLYIGPRLSQGESGVAEISFFTY